MRLLACVRPLCDAALVIEHCQHWHEHADVPLYLEIVTTDLIRRATSPISNRDTACCSIHPVFSSEAVGAAQYAVAIWIAMLININSELDATRFVCLPFASASEE
jgi:hypothetical protein